MVRWVVFLLGLCSLNFGVFAQVLQTSSRESLCLNGAWKFMPAIGPSLNEPLPQEEAWGLIRVPGKWAGFRLPGIIQRGRGPHWDAFSDRVARSWYERTVHIPEHWQGRQIVLEFKRIGTDAIVFVDGNRCGEVRWPGGEVDITQFARPGADIQLRLLVVATPNEAQVPELFAGRVSAHDFQGWQWACGITGEVFLHSRPKGAHIADVFVQPSVRRKELTLSVELVNIAQSGRIEFTARLINEKGQTEQVFRATADVHPAPTQTVSLSWRWTNPRLWDVGQPNLYTLVLQAQGAGMADEFALVFGFREFWIEGRRFFLNGKEIRLRPFCLPDEWTDYAGAWEYINGVLDGLMKAGFNIGEQWPWDDRERGRINFRYLWAEAGNRKGFLIMGALPSMFRFLLAPDWRFIWDEKHKTEWAQEMLTDLKVLRNHPSIVLWATTANLFGMPQDQNPLLIGRKGMRKDRLAEAGREGIALIKRYDPTRPVFTHQGADVGDLHTVNMYLNLVPLQEREEWLSEWARKGDLPFLAIEFGTPFHATFLRGRNGFGEAIYTEPLATEFCAIYLGTTAYAMETDAYRARIASSFQNGQRYSSWHGARELMELPSFQAVEALFARHTWRSWRTWGISGGMVPWEWESQGWRRDPSVADQPVTIPWQEGKRGAYYETLPRWAVFYLQPEGGWIPLPMGRALVENNGATLAWIAGAPGNFSEKEHHFLSGEKVRKQIVLINDARNEQAFEVEWSVHVGRQLLLTNRLNGRLKPSETRFLPIDFTLPSVTAPREGVIRMAARIGTHRHGDSFPFRVYPPLKSTIDIPRVAVFDPEGETKKTLKRLGVPIEAWDGSSKTPLLVIGRRALEKGHLPGNLSAFVREGGRVIIFAQSPDWLRQNMGFRVAHHVSRRVFPVPSQKEHPVVHGLDEEDLRDWCGQGTLVPEFWGGVEEFPNTDPPFGWHWGNRGSVTSCAIEKPHRSGWTPLLECEFDLAYTPLMELRYGKGLAVWCTLDLERSGKDEPIASEIVLWLLRYAETTTVPPRLPTFFIGDDASEKVLQALGVKYERAKGLPSPPALLIIGDDASLSEEQLRVFLQNGGRVFLLPRSREKLPFGFQTERRAFGGSLQVPDWEECRGLSPSDLRLRTDVVLPVFAKTQEGEIGANGLLGRLRIGEGVVVLVSLTPEMLNASERTYLRYSAWRLTRTLCQLLANLGAVFEMDEHSLEFGWYLARILAPSGEELLRNNAFRQELRDWIFEQHEPAKATASVVEEVPSPLQNMAKAVKISVTQPGTEGWHAQINQRDLVVRQGQIYTLTFWAKADRPCSVTVALQRAGPSYEGLGLWETVAVMREWRLFHFRFVATQSDDKARLNFSDLGRQPVTFWLALPSLKLGEQEEPEGFYHPDYLEGQALGDNPYRYYRW